jgi:NADH-quinone oxidoreductase subunit L
MLELVWLIPLLPLVSATLLICCGGRLPNPLVALLGVGSVGVAALCVLLTFLAWLDNPVPHSQHLWSWMAIGAFQFDFSFYVDGLTLVMMSVITGVGFLIHLYSAEFMAGDASYSRYFAYLNLFVAAMLVLVLGDNLLVLYLGWRCWCWYWETTCWCSTWAGRVWACAATCWWGSGTRTRPTAPPRARPSW